MTHTRIMLALPRRACVPCRAASVCAVPCAVRCVMLCQATTRRQAGWFYFVREEVEHGKDCNATHYDRVCLKGEFALLLSAMMSCD